MYSTSGRLHLVCRQLFTCTAVRRLTLLYSTSRRAPFVKPGASTLLSSYRICSPTNTPLTHAPSCIQGKHPTGHPPTGHPTPRCPSAPQWWQ
jgi:hypothetical protein